MDVRDQVRARAGRRTAAEVVHDRLTSLWLALQVRLLAERERWALWLPVGFGGGIAVYFALPSEPPGWIGLVAVGFAALFALQARGRTWVMLGALALGAVGAGFGAAQLRTHLVAAPVLHEEHGPARLHATVLEVEPRDTGHRLRLGDPEVARLATAVERQNALKRLELILEMETRSEYADRYAALLATIDEMERDAL